MELTATAMPVQGMAAPARPPLHARTDEINALIEQLEAGLIHLGDQLEPVLRPNTPTPDKEAPALRGRADDDSWLAEYLGQTAGRINDLIRRTYRLVERIDL